MLVTSKFPAVKRDVYIERWLDQGDYLLIPKSSGLNERNRGFCEGTEELNIDPKSPLFKSTLKDLF